MKLSALAALMCMGIGLVAAQEPTPPTRLPNLVKGLDNAHPTLPINLPTALHLANASPLDIAVAMERLQIASAQQDRAKVLWLPNISMGADYARHDGQIQDIVGRVFTTSRSSLMIGAGPNAVFAVNDAIYAPLAARQFVRARQAEVEVARNNSLLAVVEAYVGVQQARGEVAGAADTVRRADDLVQRAEKLAPALVPTVEINRAKTEQARRRQGLELAYERWQTASAELVRLLRLDASAVVEPMEEPHIRIELIDVQRPVDDLIPVALSSRPELAANQAIVQATLTRLKQEKIRPLVPSVLLRGNATNPAGTLAGGYFGGGVNDNLSNFGARNSVDLQLVWELQNLGLGNRAAVKERAAENRQAVFELFRTQDRVAAEVVQALAQAQRAANRVRIAEEGIEDAVQTADKNLEGLGQTKRAGDALVLIFRPQEAVAAVTALDQAYRDYYAAVADANRGQFRLYRALGQPAQCILPVEKGGSGVLPNLANPPVAAPK